MSRKKRKKFVYVTGIGGRIGRALVNGLRGEYRLRGIDREPVDMDGAEVVVGDVCDRPLMEEELQTVDAVVHLAADPWIRAGWESLIRNNIDGTHSVYEAARKNDVAKVVFASTNHVTGVLTQQGKSVDTGAAVRPDSLYGVSKVTGEALARYYADCFDIASVCLRIGWYLGADENVVVEKLGDQRPGSPARTMWLSERDCVEVHRRAIEADVHFGIYYAMSNNSGSQWDMRNTRTDLGYRPKDDIEEILRPG